MLNNSQSLADQDNHRIVNDLAPPNLNRRWADQKIVRDLMTGKFLPGIIRQALPPKQRDLKRGVPDDALKLRIDLGFPHERYWTTAWLQPTEELFDSLKSHPKYDGELDGLDLEFLLDVPGMSVVVDAVRLPQRKEA